MIGTGSSTVYFNDRIISTACDVVVFWLTLRHNVIINYDKSDSLKKYYLNMEVIHISLIQIVKKRQISYFLVRFNIKRIVNVFVI